MGGKDVFDLARQYLALGRCVIPSGGGPDGKTALVPWKPYQTSKPTVETVQRWQNDLRPRIWAMPTGPVSGCFVVDADTMDAVASLEGLGLHAHVRTKKGAHFYCRLPSWNISNAAKMLPGFDIRGQGGYVNFCGESGKAHYEVLIMPTDSSLYRVEQLPQELRDSLRPKQEVLAEQIFQRALSGARQGNRNDTGLWLACQLRDNGVPQSEAEAVMLRFAAQVRSLGTEVYTEAEATASLHQAYSKPPREPWHVTTPARSVNSFHLTDLGNAERLVRQFGSVLHYCYERKRWLAWNGKIWEWDSGDRIASLAKIAVRNIYHEAGDEPDEKRRKEIVGHAGKSESDPRLTSMINLAQSEPEIPIKVTELDTDPWLFNCRNGTIDLRSGKLLPHRKEDLITILVPIDYNPEAVCSQWMQFLDRVTGSNEELIVYLQRAVGYSLTGDTKGQILFFLYGLGSNGKSTFITTIRKIVGAYGTKANTSLFMAKEKNSKGPSEDLANLQGKRFVMASEIEDGRHLAVVLIKDMTGGEPIRADRKFEHEVEFQPVHKIWLVGNHKPVITDTTLSIWRRVKLIPFTVTIAGKEVDPDLPAKLESELPGILSWAVRGCLDWQKAGFGEPKAVASATSDYRHEQDLLGDFIDDCCQLQSSFTVPKQELKKAYEEWCNKTDSQPVSQKVFRSRLVERGITDGKSGGTRYWRGIALSDSEGQQRQMGQEGQLGHEMTESFLMREKQNSFTEKPVPTCPDVPSQSYPDYPNYPGAKCPICGGIDYTLNGENRWECSICNPFNAKQGVTPLGVINRM